jgi:hypothetical protein
MVRLMPLSTSILTRLQYQHQALPELIDGLSEQQLKQRINPDKWSAFENIAHLAAYQPTFIVRMERIAVEEAPSFERYVAEKDPGFPVYLNYPLQTILEYIPLRAAIITTQLTHLDEAGLLRVALHPKYGRLTVTQWTQFYLLHEAHHLFTIFMLSQDLRSARV